MTFRGDIKGEIARALADIRQVDMELSNKRASNMGASCMGEENQIS